jgi:mono/diheme cytochrome c family protein
MKRILIALAVAALAAAAAAWVISAPVGIDPAVAAAVSAPGDAAAGKIIFFAGGCESCHMSQGQPDPLRLGGGFELKSPFGSFYPPNISSDAHDGIGSWTAVDLANALLAGVSPEGQHYYPAFPYTSYHLIKPEDVRDLYAFLHTLPAVQGRAPPHGLVFPFTIRRAVGLWKFLFFNQAPLPAVSGKSPAWMLGRYVVEGPGHCAECHSPRNLLGAIVASQRLAGGPNPDGKGKTSNITAAGLAKWSKEDIVEVLTSGLTPDGDTILGSAMEPVMRNLAQLPPYYREGIAEYLKSSPEGGGPVENSKP